MQKLLDEWRGRIQEEANKFEFDDASAESADTTKTVKGALKQIIKEETVKAITEEVTWKKSYEKLFGQSPGRKKRRRKKKPAASVYTSTYTMAGQAPPAPGTRAYKMWKASGGRERSAPIHKAAAEEVAVFQREMRQEIWCVATTKCDPRASQCMGSLRLPSRGDEEVEGRWTCKKGYVGPMTYVDAKTRGDELQEYHRVKLAKVFDADKKSLEEILSGGVVDLKGLKTVTDILTKAREEPAVLVGSGGSSVPYFKVFVRSYISRRADSPYAAAGQGALIKDIKKSGDEFGGGLPLGAPMAGHGLMAPAKWAWQLFWKVRAELKHITGEHEFARQQGKKGDYAFPWIWEADKPFWYALRDALRAAGDVGGMTGPGAQQVVRYATNLKKQIEAEIGPPGSFTYEREKRRLARAADATRRSAQAASGPMAKKKSRQIRAKAGAKTTGVRLPSRKELKQMHLKLAKTDEWPRIVQNLKYLDEIEDSDIRAELGLYDMDTTDLGVDLAKNILKALGIKTK
jgi:hypothetical protein